MTTRAKRNIIITSAVLLVVFFVFLIPNLVFIGLGSQKQVGSAKGYDWSSEDAFDINKHVTKTIEIGSDDFKILCIADIQRRNGGTAVKFLGTNLILDWISEPKLRKMIKNTKPDLIVTVGDNMATKTTNDIELKHIADFLDSFNTPWTTIFGNHDGEGRADKARLCEILMESEYGIFEYGPNDLHGVGNFIINLTRNSEIVYSIYMMDSGEHISTGGYDGINERQVEWYKWATNGINQYAKKEVKNIAFFHIPLPEYNDILESDYIAGSKGETIASQEINGGFFDAFKENNGTHIFVGHDHANNFYANHEGVILGYVQKSSINGSFDSKKLGGTMLQIDNDNTIDISIINY